MSCLLVTESAQADLDQIWLFIARDNPAAGDQFLNRLLHRCQSYAHQPLLGEERPELGSDVRCFSVGHYVVFYLPLSAGIQVSRVIHGARDIRDRFGVFVHPLLAMDGNGVLLSERWTSK